MPERIRPAGPQLVTANLNWHAASDRWRIYVTAEGRVQDWPEHYFPAGQSQAPTPPERAAALRGLGYVTVESAWSWFEHETTPLLGEPSWGMYAYLHVCPITVSPQRAETEVTTHA